MAIQPARFQIFFLKYIFHGSGYLPWKAFKSMLSVEYLAASYLCSDKFSPNLTVQIINVYIVYVKCRTCYFFIFLLCKV